MVFLEQSSNFSLFPGDSANINCFFPFLKLNFQSLWIAVDSCSPAGPDSSSKSVSFLRRRRSLFVGHPLVAYSLTNMGALSYA